MSGKQSSHRNNFEQQPKRTASSTLAEKNRTSTATSSVESVEFAAISSRTMFSKTSTSSTSSISSSTYSLVNEMNLTSGQLLPINPFEETNKFRLEQSVLSPNLFHVANTSTPERDTNSLWNIDQRAILYPVDIPTDESSLMPQYVYDLKISKQVNPAVEVFWSQNKIIIESPLTGTTGSALRAKFGANNSQKKASKASSVSSPLTCELQQKSKSGSNLVSSSSSTGAKLSKHKREHKDQMCQTMLSLPSNFDLSKIPELKPFLLCVEESCEFASPKKDSVQLNNSIRKKLFDQFSEDSSTSTTTPVLSGSSIILSKIKPDSKKAANLPRPEIFSSSDNDQPTTTTPRVRTLASSSSSNAEEAWNRSFEFDDHKFSSSPKQNKQVLCDFGDDELNDSVFMSQHHRTPPDLSPLVGTPKRQLHSNSEDKENELFVKNQHPPHHNRYIHFEAGHETGSCSSKKNSEKMIGSPNLSPIRQTTESTNCTLAASNNKTEGFRSLGSSGRRKAGGAKAEHSLSKSIIFMEVGESELPKSNESARLAEPANEQNISFIEPIVAHEHHNHYKREEFYEQNSFVELKPAKFDVDEELVNFTFRNSLSALQAHSDEKPLEANLESTKSVADPAKKFGEQINNSKPLFTTMSSMIETTSTFNQDSQDTGYQTNSANCGNGSGQSSYNPSMMCMDTTGNNNVNEISSLNVFSTNKPSCCDAIPKLKKGGGLALEPDAVPSSSEQEIGHLFKPIENHPVKRPLNLELKNALSVLVNEGACKNMSKKNSISLNSLQDIHPVESSTPELTNLNNLLNAESQMSVDCSKKVYFVKSKTIMNLNQQQKDHKMYKQPSHGKSFSAHLQHEPRHFKKKEKPLKDHETSSDHLTQQKHELDSAYLQDSILMNKMTPSEYARAVIQKAKSDLQSSVKFVSKPEATNKPSAKAKFS